jgi:hypothetical protein
LIKKRGLMGMIYLAAAVSDTDGFRIFCTIRADGSGMTLYRQTVRRSASAQDQMNRVAGQADLQSDVALMHEHGKADR